MKINTKDTLFRACANLLLVFGLLGLSMALVPSSAEASAAFPSSQFQIQATGTDLCVDIPGNNARAGADLWLWKCNGTAAQAFAFKDGRIVNPSSGLCLDVENNGRIGAAVQVAKCVGKDSRWHNAQAWRIHGRDLAVPGDRCLDAAGTHNSIRAEKHLEVNTCGYPAKNFRVISTGGTTLPPQPPAPPVSGSLVKAIVTAAEAEHDRWSLPNGRRYTERDSWATPVLRSYYDAAGWSPWNKRSDWKTYYAWSAAYISYVMQKAGATDFHASFRHFDYIKAGLNTSGSFRTLDPARTAVKVGDLVCSHRHSGKITYASVKRIAAKNDSIKTHCDVVVVVGSKSIQVLGGNTADQVDKYGGHTVGRKWFRTTNGILNKGKWIGVIRP